ncbi:putative mitochondrial short-chain dehydrogenase [Leptomonas pyrrhocoris]|uniref:Putative mitochondrial short-chain dehydrogenase n=1 Tax=Leptomonas pyrrhocoris TaxID=157538 RepID=A0A0M9G337_LEPPY|nr:putative mitochondrial short-chain dehydrogenase [Leptomonas pyrrhocoris]XP_015659618.1 putative mitochondrial short-chain dehydrogenase [Leptomonas pyrrhocoris]KPA81178.1 putative mitochondrial short-chain dehydrogenase [Leptomonas pyrrhocoris]KPA81179.1 putative mitochondrial short-chain dehydrogenase [Leptomonas pyrrhocoris]|eukprot:XP_015659617.1 putative mitochondrial short-chain dehydrogenase [Leptomonas pyrrhocoris]
MIYIDTWIWAIFCYICGWIGLLSILTYLIAIAIEQIALYFPQDLAKKYKAKWGLVTGSSSGIGKAIAEKLAGQGISVVLVALDDKILEDTFQELQKKYPRVEFRKVGVNLAAKDYAYMADIKSKTDDLEINVLFNNAGYICTGLFADTDLERLRCNLECNAGCAVPITHHFLRKMIERKVKGLITFTSSASCYLPGPTATLYSPSKAFLTNFGSTIAAENHDLGIDVVVIHPSPVNTNFYKNEGPSLNSLKAAQKAAASPMNIADQIFASAGRLTVWDQGTTCAVFRVVNKILDFQIFTEIVTRFAFLNGDHSRLKKESKLRQGKE